MTTLELGVEQDSSSFAVGSLGMEDGHTQGCPQGQTVTETSLCSCQGKQRDPSAKPTPDNVIPSFLKAPGATPASRFSRQGHCTERNKALPERNNNAGNGAGMEISFSLAGIMDPDRHSLMISSENAGAG